MENIAQAQPMMGMPTTQPATGLSAWMDKETFWYMVKVILFAAVVIFGIKYFYDKNQEKKALEKVEPAASETNEGPEGGE